MMKIHRIHFDVLKNREAVRNVWCGFSQCCVNHKLLPERMFETGRSKRDAMKHTVDILDSASFFRFMDKAQSIKGLPGVYLGSLWAERGERERDFSIKFSTNLHAFRMPYFVVLEVVDEESKDVEDAIRSIWSEKKIYCIDVVLGVGEVEPTEIVDSEGFRGDRLNNLHVYDLLYNKAIGGKC